MWLRNFNQKCDDISLDDPERLTVACELMLNDAKLWSDVHGETCKDWKTFQDKLTALFRRPSRLIQFSYDQQLLIQQSNPNISVNRHYIVHRQHINDSIRQRKVKTEQDRLNLAVQTD